MGIHVITNILGGGKTSLAVLLVEIEYLQDAVVYSNVHLEFPYIPTDSINDMDKVRSLCSNCGNPKPIGVRNNTCPLCGCPVFKKAVWLIDDAYNWLYGLLGFEKGMLKILSCSRKRGVDIILTCTRTNQIQINVRNNIASIWFPIVVPGIDLLIARQFEYLPDRGQKGGDEERIGRPIQQFILTNIKESIWELFDTEQEISDLKGAKYTTTKGHETRNNYEN